MFNFGVDYYPEQWPEERWPIDATLMAQAGINFVRLAEFAWGKMEPEEGSFHFEWLDRAIDLLFSHGIRVILGTPTASIPPWLAAYHPDVLLVHDDRKRVEYGGRRMYCPNHPTFRGYSRRITAAMAEHYHAHPAVIGWQIDNEFGDPCYCPICQRKFQDWLQERFGSLEVLNEKYGTQFWSHVYSDWQQIPLPSALLGQPSNPGLALDYKRFVSDSYVSFQEEQIQILRKFCPG